MSEVSHVVSTPVLQITGLERRYQSGDSELTVLDGADLRIGRGENIGLIGQSGSGKSSLLHAAGLLERPSGGDVIIEADPHLSTLLDLHYRQRLHAQAGGESGPPHGAHPIGGSTQPVENSSARPVAIS